MKKVLFIALTALALSSCKKEDPEGTLTVWTSDRNTTQITVKIDGTDYGTITMSYREDPGCSAAGCVTAKLKAGAYTVRANSGTGSWEKAVTVKADMCNTLELTP